MRLLLDTQIFVWATIGDRRLGPKAREFLSNAAQIYVSVASIWEIAIKARLGKIDADPRRMVDAIGESGFLELPVSALHAAGVERLPPHHGDPFDRLLVAQALAEPLRLVTVDRMLEQYTDLVIRI